MTALFFWLFSVGMIVCALAVVFNRNAVASALCFTFTIVFMAGLFVMLSAFFLAAVQILVTAGAVMVLFLFIIMLLDLTAMEHAPRHKVWTACSVVLALAFLGLIGKTLHTMPAQQWPAEQQASEPMPVTQPPISIHGTHLPIHGALATTKPEPSQSETDKMDDTHQIGRMLFAASKVDPVTGEVTTSYIAPFEITSLLILVATIGVIVLCKEDDRPKAYRREEIAREAPPVREQEPSLKS